MTLTIKTTGWLALLSLAAPSDRAVPTSPVQSNAVAAAVYEWNLAGFECTSACGQNAIIASRAAAMMHAAIHDALNAITRRYEPCIYMGVAEPGALPDAAITAAAADVMTAIITQLHDADAEEVAKARAVLATRVKASLDAIPEGDGKKRGISVGKAAAAAVLALRKNDNCDAKSDYTPKGGPGRWVPHPNPVPPNPPIEDAAKAPGNVPAVLPQWGIVTPFTMTSPWQFRMAPPPALTSEAYARDFAEVKRIGGKSSTERTPAQTEIAKAWYDGSPHHWSRIACLVGAERGLDEWDAARLLALVNMAVADSYIAGADSRYHYDLWRPVTAIRAAADDGNDATTADPAWESLLNTPALPDYPSTHSVCSGAASVVLAKFFGNDAIAFTVESGPPFAGSKRSFKSFTQAAIEVCDSRVYAGVHFRTACTEGMKTGQLIGRRAFATCLRPHEP